MMLPFIRIAVQQITYRAGIVKDLFYNVYPHQSLPPLFYASCYHHVSYAQTHGADIKYMMAEKIKRAWRKTGKKNVGMW